jgi:hypothetical protein
LLDTYWNLVRGEGRFWLDGHIRFTEQSAKPGTLVAGSGDWNLYMKSGGLYYEDDNGTETGPLTAGISDHGGLTGLSDDDHSIYALLAGRTTGQTLKGGTASGADLTLMSTNHATKGHLLFGTSGYDEVNNRLGIGHTAPAFGVHASGASPGCHVSSNRLSADALGPAFIGQKARGTPGSPTVVLANDQLLQLVGQGYENGSYHTQSNIKIFAAENWSGSAKGTYITFETAAAGGTTITEKLRLLSDGKLGLGITNPTYHMEISNDSPLALALRNAGAGGAYAIHFLRSRNTVASPQATASGDSLGSLNWGGYQGASWAEARLRIIGWAGSLWSGSNQETYMTFQTTPSGSTTPSERLRIESSGDISHASGVRHRMLSQNRFRHLNSIAKVKRTADQTISTSTITAVAFNAADDNDTDALHDPASNNTRVTIALAGKYIVGGVMRYEANGSGSNRQARVHKNGSLVDGAFNNDHSPNASQESHVFVSCMIEAAAADYFEFAAFQDSGGDLDVQASQTRFWVIYVGE